MNVAAIAIIDRRVGRGIEGLGMLEMIVDVGVLLAAITMLSLAASPLTPSYPFLRLPGPSDHQVVCSANMPGE